jgi:hypothetical protein
MKQSKILMASIVAGTTLMGLGRPASGNVESFTANYGSSSSPLTVGGPDFPASLTLQKFDSSLGHLTDIEILLTTDALLQADVFNAGGTANFFNAQANATFTLLVAGAAESTVTLATTPFNGSVTSGALFQGPGVSLAGTDLSHVASADFSSYEYGGGGGIGSFLDVNLLGAASYDGTGPAGLFFGGNASAYGSVEIKYEFATVPETGALWADLGILACGFAVFRRACRSGCYPAAR